MGREVAHQTVESRKCDVCGHKESKTKGGHDGWIRWPGWGGAYSMDEGPDSWMIDACPECFQAIQSFVKRRTRPAGEAA